MDGRMDGQMNGRSSIFLVIRIYTAQIKHMAPLTFLGTVQDFLPSSTAGRIHFFYCSCCPGRAVLMPESAFSTAPYACFEQYWCPNPLSLLLPLPGPSSTKHRIRYLYCSVYRLRAVLTTDSAFSTAPNARTEQYCWPIPLFLLLLIPVTSSTNDRFCSFYCS